MGSESSEELEQFDQQSVRCGSYSLSADVSDSESCSSFTGRRCDDAASSSIASSPLLHGHPIGNSAFFPPMFPLLAGKDAMLWGQKPHKRDSDLSENDMMKERFAKLLLGEDMSGGGNGVCTALAISNAITNLSASVFGELWRLEPFPAPKRAMWCREMEWLLCVSDSIVELVPSIQHLPTGGTYEIMETRPRSDLYVNLPALKKIDAMLLSILDGFHETEFWYVDRGIMAADVDKCDAFSSDATGGRPSVREEEKWWLPYPNVPPNGLSEKARKSLQQCRDCTNQILKAALAINSMVLSEMEIPTAYVDSLPKSIKACLGDVLYRHINAEQFSPENLLDCLDLSTEHHTLEVANQMEAAVYYWRLKDRKMTPTHRKHQRNSWGGKVKGHGERSLAQRSETLLHCLRIRFPSLPQTALEMSKIQYNRDVGQAILESYSRVMESLAFNVMARIDDVLFVDDATKRCNAENKSLFNRGGFSGCPIQKRMSPSPFSVQHTPYASPFATPIFPLSPRMVNSPRRDLSPVSESGTEGSQHHTIEKMKPSDFEKLWSYAGDLNAKRTGENAPERD